MGVPFGIVDVDEHTAWNSLEEKGNVIANDVAVLVLLGPLEGNEIQPFGSFKICPVSRRLAL